MGKSNDIRAAVIDDLTFDPDVDASDIRVEELDGDVVLTGSVPSYPQYVQAAAVAARAVGVRCVRNHLQVALPPGDHRDDLTLAAMASDDGQWARHTRPKARRIFLTASSTLACRSRIKAVNCCRRVAG